MNNKIKFLWLVPCLALTSCGEKKYSPIEVFVQEIKEELYMEYYTYAKYSDSSYNAPHYLVYTNSHLQNPHTFECSAKISYKSVLKPTKFKLSAYREIDIIKLS